MDLDPLAPAQVRCLLLPCGIITRSRFLSFVARLQQEVTVRLGDVSPNGGPHRTMFSPLAFPSGVVFYHLLTASPSPSQRALAPLELYREPLVVVGIADAGECRTVQSSRARSTASDASDALEGPDFDDISRRVEDFKDVYSSALVHLALVFDCDGPGTSMPPSLIAVSSLEHSTTTTMKTIMCDLTSLLLSELTAYAKSLQALPNIETPRQLLGSGGSAQPRPRDDIASRPRSRMSETSRSRSPSPVHSASRNTYRASLPSRSDLSNDVTRSTSVAFDQMDAHPPRTGSVSAEGDSRTASRDRASMHGFGSNGAERRARNRAKARLAIVMGSMYLLAGRWPDAIKELTEGATAAKASNDHIWHAKALDFLLVSLLMCAWAGVDFEIPQVCYSSGEKSTFAPFKSPKLKQTATLSDLSASESQGSAERLLNLQRLSSLLPDLVHDILHLYDRAASFTAEKLPQLALSHSIIRFCKLLAIVETSGGLFDDQMLEALVLNTPDRSQRTLLQLQNTSLLSRSAIASLTYRAIPSPAAGRYLDIPDTLGILAGIASVLARLGYHRKKVFVLRELISILLPALIQRRKDSAAELGIHPAAELSPLHFHSLSEDAPDGGIQGLLSSICEVYGVVLSASPDDSIPKKDVEVNETDVSNGASLSNSPMRALDHAVKRSFGNQQLKMDVLHSCISICETLPDLRGVLRFSSNLLATAGSGIAPGPESVGGSPILPMDDQTRVASNIIRAVEAAKYLGAKHIAAEYWDEFLIRNIEILDPPPAERAISHERSELSMDKINHAEGRSGPLIHDPLKPKVAASTQQRMLICGEETYFLLLVQNLSDIDLELESLQLDTVGSFESTIVRNVLIGPYRTQRVRLTGVPREVGQLTIVGCTAKVKGCQTRQYLLYVDPWKLKVDERLKRQGLACMLLPIERPVPLSARPTTSQALPAAPPVAKTVSVSVIPSQPLLQVHATSLSQSTIMVLEGEATRFTLTVQNASSRPIDLLWMSFEDSTTAMLQSAVANKGLTSGELYEIELMAYRKQALRWVKENDDVLIVPGGSFVIEVEVLGKPGLTSGTVQVNYGHLGVPPSDIEGPFYTRQLSFPFSVTVNASIELVHNDTLPFTGEFAWRNQQRSSSQNGSAHSTPHFTISQAQEWSQVAVATQERFQPLFNRLGLGTQGEDHCLMLLDFYNAWPSTLSLSLQVREALPEGSPTEDSWTRAYTVHEIQQTGETARIVLVLPRVTLADPHAPIPSINAATKRQFVLSADKFSPDYERAMREAFWHREEILKYMRATWEDTKTGRRGDIELRALRLTARMIDALKMEEVGIDMLLKSTPAAPDESGPADSTPVERLGRSRFRVPVDGFVTLSTRLTNRLPRPVYPLLRLMPSLRNQPYNIALDMSKKLAFNGLLQQPLPLLAAGESRTTDLNLIFLTTGEFEIGACVEEVRIWKPPASEWQASAARERAATDDLGLLQGKKERRVWYVREACAIEAFDAESARL